MSGCTLLNLLKFMYINSCGHTYGGDYHEKKKGISVSVEVGISFYLLWDFTRNLPLTLRKSKIRSKVRSVLRLRRLITGNNNIPMSQDAQTCSIIQSVIEGIIFLLHKRKHERSHYRPQSRLIPGCRYTKVSPVPEERLWICHELSFLDGD